MSIEPLLYALATIFAIGKAWGSLSQRLTNLERLNADHARSLGEITGRLDALPCRGCPDNREAA